MSVYFKTGTKVSETRFDYIIIGAGSAGSALAGRLAENTKLRILLLEAGPKDYHPYLKIPIGYGRVFFDDRFNWKFTTEPEPQMYGSQMYWPRGKVLGGSSAINAMVFVRGHQRDFDEWGASASGWSWADVEPYFRRMEHWQGIHNQNRGLFGPVSISNVSDKVHPLTQRYLEAAQQIGFKLNDDYNSGDLEGACIYQITTSNGVRVSSATAYLKKFRRTKHLKILTQAQATKILFEDQRAVGVEYVHKGTVRRAKAESEVILSAGALLSPHLLQVSGIGPEKLLKAHGVEVLVDSQNVGRNLSDHLGLDHTLQVNKPSLNQTLRPLYGKLAVALEYIFTRKGPLSMSLNQGGGFVKSQKGLDVPDLQLYFSPLSYSTAPKGTRPLMKPDPYPAVRLGFNLCKPTSMGLVEICSSNALLPPKFYGNYLATEEDREGMIRGMRLMRKISEAPALKNLITLEESPGLHLQSDEELLDFARRDASTVFHQCGTCRMGSDPLTSVVDEALRVRGVRCLRVADASAFPTIPTGNTNAASVMVGEKAADLILADL